MTEITHLHTWRFIIYFPVIFILMGVRAVELVNASHFRIKIYNNILSQSGGWYSAGSPKPS